MCVFSLSAVSLAQNTRQEERPKPSNTQDLFLYAPPPLLTISTFLSIVLV